jgi:hypothetical protein
MTFAPKFNYWSASFGLRISEGLLYYTNLVVPECPYWPTGIFETSFLIGMLCPVLQECFRFLHHSLFAVIYSLDSDSYCLGPRELEGCWFQDMVTLKESVLGVMMISRSPQWWGFTSSAIIVIISCCWPVEPSTLVHHKLQSVWTWYSINWSLISKEIKLKAYTLWVLKKPKVLV